MYTIWYSDEADMLLVCERSNIDILWGMILTEKNNEILAEICVKIVLSLAACGLF